MSGVELLPPVQSAEQRESLLRALACQRQIDEDGTEVGVSREAVDVAAEYITYLTRRVAELERALRGLVGDMEQTGSGTTLVAYQAARAALKGQG